MPGFVISSNLPGYLPMNDDPLVVADWQSAWESFKEFALNWAEQSDELYDEVNCGHPSESEHSDECYGTDVAMVESILADLAQNLTKDTNPQGWHIYVNSNDGQTYALFCAWSEDATPEEN